MGADPCGGHQAGVGHAPKRQDNNIAMRKTPAYEISNNLAHEVRLLTRLTIGRYPNAKARKRVCGPKVKRQRLKQEPRDTIG